MYTRGESLALKPPSNTSPSLPFTGEGGAELLEAAGIGVYTTTPDGRILFANMALAKMLGYSSIEEIAQRNLSTEGFSAGYPRERFIEKIESEGEVRGFEALWTRRDGSTIVVRETARVVRDSEGKTVAYEGIVQDITEHRKTEEALKNQQQLLELKIAERTEELAKAFEELKSSQKRLEAILKALPDLLVVVRRDGVVLECYPGHKVRDFIRKPESYIGKHILECENQEFSTSVFEKIAYVIDTNTDTQNEIALEIEGEKRFFEVRCLKNDDESALCIIRERTQEKELEKALLESEKRYRMLVELSPEPIAVHSGGVVVFANQSALNLVGFKKAGRLDR